MELQESKNLPAILSVDASKPLFAAENNQNVNTAAHGNHVVVIRGLVPGTPGKILVDNQWGKQNDKAVSTDDLFKDLGR